MTLFLCVSARVRACACELACLLRPARTLLIFTAACAERAPEAHTHTTSPASRHSSKRPALGACECVCVFFCVCVSFVCVCVCVRVCACL